MPTDSAVDDETVTGAPATTDAAEDSASSPPGLSEHQTKVLLRLLRVAYPHPSFPDAPYERTSKAVQEAGLTDHVLADGLDQLDENAGGDFLAVEDERATQIIADLADSDFFTRIHATTVVALYDDHEVWDLLGYEGSAFEKGGYLHRGFDDLDWLPKPRIEEYDGEPRPELISEGSAS